MDDRQKGVTVRGNKIQIAFSYLGKRCRESLHIEATKPNLKHATRLKATIEHEIALGTFSYVKHFPRSKNAHLGLRTSNKTITQALDEYMQAARRVLELSTIRGYRSAIEYYLKPTFGGLRLADLSSAMVKSWIGGLTISNKRINNVLIPLRTIFSDAFSDGLIDKDPMIRVRNLPIKTEEPHPLNPTEIQAILKELPQQGKNFIQFAIWTGLRTSELVALEWGDIDFNVGLIRVRRAIVNKNKKQPKTKAGERDVKLFPPALEALRNQKQFTFLANERVFNNPKTNKPWETDAQIRRTLWIPALKKAGVIYRTPYQTRHTYASTLLSAGENPLWVAKQMGHKDWGMIRRVYGRWIAEIDNSAGDKVMKFWAQTCLKENIND